MSEGYTFLRNDQLKIMQDTLEKQKACIDFLQDTIDTLDYELSVYKNALDILSLRTNVIDRTINNDWVWSAKRWKDWAIESAKESMEESKKEREE